LFHYPLPFLLPVSVFASVPTVLGSQIPALLLYMSFSTLVAVAIAIATWHTWEKHFLKLKRYFPYRHVSTSGAKAPAGSHELPSLASL
jgi:hypothetical protein